MQAIELQNQIIHKVLEIDDVGILQKLKMLLFNPEELYVLSKTEKDILLQRMQDKSAQHIENNDFFEEIESWLKEK
jgi:hypothetical protein